MAESHQVFLNMWTKSLRTILNSKGLWVRPPWVDVVDYDEENTCAE